MNICVCTIPIRHDPTTFPPFGSMAIIQSIQGMDVSCQFYNIDYHRPGDDQVKEYFLTNQFDMVAISAVVSTAYAYTKKLTRLIRSVSPQSIIILGGNLAASSEILLKKCSIDYCVIGDGELIIRNLIEALRLLPVNKSVLRDIKGIAFLDDEGEFYFTGYLKPPLKEDISYPDYSLLDKDGSIDHYVSEDVSSQFYGTVSEEEAKNKKVMTVITSKGCINRCTFCHRWEIGYRIKPVDTLLSHIIMLRDKYHVSYLNIGDENFGSAKKWTKDFVTKLGELKMSWRCAGVRVGTADLETLKFWKENGCKSVIFGTESGSQKMLDIMEKNASVSMNIDALKWSCEAGLLTVVQLVIGMPGEDDDTIRENIDFLKTVTPYLMLGGATPASLISINYAQALPGSPLYEYARQNGYIGSSIADEENYLLSISDIDAYSADHFLNYTGQPLLKVRTWRAWILAEVEAHYLQNTCKVSLSFREVLCVLLRYFSLSLRDRGGFLSQLVSMVPSHTLKTDLIAEKMKKAKTDQKNQSGYFNIKEPYFVCLFLNRITKKFSYPLLSIGVALGFSHSFREFVEVVMEHVVWSSRKILPWLKKGNRVIPGTSLRKQVDEFNEMSSLNEHGMMLIRKGR